MQVVILCGGKGTRITPVNAEEEMVLRQSQCPHENLRIIEAECADCKKRITPQDDKRLDTVWKVEKVER